MWSERVCVHGMEKITLRRTWEMLTLSPQAAEGEGSEHFLAPTGQGAGLPPGRNWVGSIAPSPAGRRTFFFLPESEAAPWGCGRARPLCAQEQSAEGCHDWMRLADLSLQEVAVCAVAWGTWGMTTLEGEGPQTDSP